MSPPPAGDDEPVQARLWQGTRPFLLLMATVVGVALVAGLVFSRADPRRAARLLLGDDVVTEEEGAATELPAPTSGAPDARPTCGVQDEPVGVQQQVDAIAGGVVVVQYRHEDDAAAVVDAVGEHTADALVAPNPDLSSPVVATAWQRRLELDEPDDAVLQAFVTAYEGLGPQVVACEP